MQVSEFRYIQFNSVSQSYPAPCDPMDCNMSGFPVHHQFLELAQSHVHGVADAIQPSHPLLSPSPAFNLSQDRVFSMSQLFTSGGQYRSFSFRTSPSNEYQGWFPLGLIGFLSLLSKDSQESSPTSQLKSINSSALSLFYCSALTSIYDYWKNHSFDYTNLCMQSYVLAFQHSF